MHRARRRWSVAVLLVVAVVVAGVAVGGAAAGDRERIASYFTVAEVRADGSARIVEVIDYDFGTGRRHGIYRTVPGLGPDADIEVSSPTAPDQWIVDTRGIRIGDPARTITGRHRYRIAYTLAGVAPGGALDWNAVGTEWAVEIEHAEVHVTAPFELTDVVCDQGSPWETGGCEAEPVAPGHLVVDAGTVPAGEGVTVSATAGTDVAAAPTAPGEPPVPDDDSAGLLVPGLLAGALALAGMVPTTLLVRRAGREEVVAGGAADMAHGADDPPLPPNITPAMVDRRDVADLADHATTEFVPPPDLSPPEGGILLAERVQAHHKVAWLVDQAAHGAVDLETVDDDTTLRWRGDHGATSNPVLLRMFDGRPEVRLGSHDPDFEASWKVLEGQLDGWRRSSPLWSAAAERRRKLVLAGGILLALLGLAGTFGAALLTGLSGRWALPLVGVAALAAGTGAAMAARSWELHVRTARGSALWLRTESFRRFIAASEARHADWAAQHGILREYTAWAVALDEIDQWSKAVEASAVARTADISAVHLATMAPALGRATSSTATKPSSSGGGGGGGVGGGSGGGGGGSW